MNDARRQFLRHDWKRWFTPAGVIAITAAGGERRKLAAPRVHVTEARTYGKEPVIDPQALARLRWMVKDLKVELTLWRLRHKYAVDQPRVPAGNPDGGQWADEERLATVRVAAADRPPLGRGPVALLALRAALEAIGAFRSDNSLRDLFGRKVGTVTWMSLDGKDIFGSNSTAPYYTRADQDAADAMRNRLLAKYPDTFDADHPGRMPSNAIYHAEANALMRGARESGGTLAGRTLEVVSDRPMCNNCPQVLPLIGLELGNPTVTFVGPSGERNTMHDGIWDKTNQ